MRRVRQTTSADQACAPEQLTIPLDDGTAMLALIQELIPLGLKAVGEALTQEVAALAGPRYARSDAHPSVVRWGKQPGSIYLADQKLSIPVPRVRDRAAGHEVPLATYEHFQTPRALDVGLFRRVLGGLSCREYEAAAEAVPDAFGLAKTSVSRRFIRANARVAASTDRYSASNRPRGGNNNSMAPSAAFILLWRRIATEAWPWNSIGSSVCG